MKDSNGKSIAAYQFGDWETVKETNQLAKSLGRTQLTQKLKNILIEKYGARCHLYGEQYPEKYQHIAGREERKLDIVFQNEDIKLYNEIVEQAQLQNISYQSMIKRIIQYYQQLNKKGKE